MRVSDLTQLLPGALATQLLGDLGADVVKVEPPGGGDKTRWIPPLIAGQGSLFRLLNRNKRSICIDLKQEQGKELLRRLVAPADVLVEGFRPGVMDQLGLGLEALRRRFPRLITCSITGYGQTGPWRDRPGHDLNYQALAGLVALGAGEGGAPALPGAQVADIGGGTWPAVAGILAALLERAQTGRGQAVDVAMADGATLFSLIAHAQALPGTRQPQPGGTLLAGALPTYGVFRCADGRHLSLGILGMLEPKFWSAFAHAVGRPEWLERDAAAEELREDLRALFLERSRDEWMSLLGGGDQCVAPVLQPIEVPAHPQMAARGVYFRDEGGLGDELPAIGLPFQLSNQPSPPRHPAAELGQHTEEILLELGLAAAEVEALRAKGIL